MLLAACQEPSPLPYTAVAVPYRGVIFPDDRTEVTVSGFDAGEGLSELQTSRSVIAQVVKGRLDFTADAEQLHAVPGSWLRTEPGTRHSLTARAEGHAPDSYLGRMNGPVVSTGRVDATVTPQRTGPEQSEVCAITPLSGARIGRGLASTGTERPTETHAGYGGAPASDGLGAARPVKCSPRLRAAPVTRFPA